MDKLEDWLGNIDMANNFHKIGGYSCLRKCLSSPSPAVRAGASHLIAEISQNNPYCQEAFISEGFLELLLQQLDSDSDDQCQVKALYAMSCVTRDSAVSLARLTALGGWSVVLRAVQRDNVKLVTKGCYLLSSAMVTSQTVLSHVLSMDIVLQLAGLLHTNIGLHHEHILAALRSLLTHSEEAREQARGEQLGLETLLLTRRAELKDQEEYVEYVEHCEAVLRLLAPEFIPSEEWREVQEWQSVPPGCHVKADLQTGKKMARIDQEPSR